MSKLMPKNASSRNEAQPPAPKTLDVYGFVPAAVYRRKKASPPPFSEDEILQWADAFHARHGCWPIARSGPIPQAYGETWRKVDSALRRGGRGLLPGSSLALLLFRHRGRRHPLHLTRFTEAQVLEWADAYFARHGAWPGVSSGIIPECPAVTWETVQQSLTEKQAKDHDAAADTLSLSEIIFDLREARKRRAKPALSEAQILAWADEHFQRTGEWPRADAGRVEASPDETWSKVAAALQKGQRGLAGGSSLARLLEQERGRVNRKNQSPYTVPQILAWADSHHARTGKWPTQQSGVIIGSPADNWGKVSAALSAGGRGLPGGTSLARLLEQKRGRRNHLSTTPLSVECVLAWADAHFARTGNWPLQHSGPVPEDPTTTWAAIDHALARGTRGLDGGSSLARLLAKERGRRNRLALPPLSEAQILTWADAHYSRTGEWPLNHSGSIPEEPGMSWGAVTTALDKGSRGLPGGSSLARLLAENGRKRNRLELAPLCEEDILAWADAHKERTGQWPNTKSGRVPEREDSTWASIGDALKRGTRGLPGGSSLAHLLHSTRRVQSTSSMPPLSEDLILQWADAYHAREERWPSNSSGPIGDGVEGTWLWVDKILREGRRGFPGGSSLARLLQQHRGRRHKGNLSPFTEARILAWADAYHTRIRHWPSSNSGPIAEAPEEKWQHVDTALLVGIRGLPGGSSLLKLLARERGVLHPADRDKFTEAQVLQWADAYHARHGCWPNVRSGVVDEQPDMTWLNFHNFLYTGGRGLPGGSSLAQLLARERGMRNRLALPPLTPEQVLAWADAFHARMGEWPQPKSGPIPEMPEETWHTISGSLEKGTRGLTGGQSLAQFLQAYGRKRTRSTYAPLSMHQIAEWACAFRQEHGIWPSTKSGEIAGADGQKWSTMDSALAEGSRGLPGGSSLRKFCAELEAELSSTEQNDKAEPEERQRAA